MKSPTYPSFIRAVDSLAPNEEGRAAVLGVSSKTIQRLRKGRLPGLFRVLAQHPEGPSILRALASDLETKSGKALDLDKIV